MIIMEQWHCACMAYLGSFSVLVSCPCFIFFPFSLIKVFSIDILLFVGKKLLQKFYMIGRDKSRTHWRVLKIDRMEPYELNIREDSTTYTERECSDLLRRIHEGNRSTGGLKFVTTCYGIVGM